SSITCIASIFLSVSELLQVLTIKHPSLWIPKVDIFQIGMVSTQIKKKTPVKKGTLPTKAELKAEIICSTISIT
ncbi:MAG: hypothetical protein ACO2PP_27125, partial [Thermocrinis sp.]|uniref:hypothetical protein n=1 Tax=Thermocrinis sp. TaxID=2024383 RepID=UPI003C04D4F5